MLRRGFFRGFKRPEIRPLADFIKKRAKALSKAGQKLPRLYYINVIIHRND